MKILIVATSAVVLLLSSPFAHAGEEEVCTAIYETLDGQEHWARVECDGPYAGKCLKEIIKNGKSEWLEVSCK